MVRKSVENNQNDVGLRILEQLLLDENEKEKNLVFSPLSIYMMLTLLAAGASENGPILNHLLSFLKFKSTQELNSFLSNLFAALFGDTSADGGPCLATANGVWLADHLPVKPSFHNLLQTLYGGKLSLVDFRNKSREVVNEANAWIKEETRGLIFNIFGNDNVNELTKMILANTIYFKAQWYSQFEERSTKNQDFHLLNGSSIQVPFMNNYKNHAVSAFDTFKVAHLSYNSGNEDFDDPRHFSMCIFLPNERDGLPSLIQRACSEYGFFDRYRAKCCVPLEEFKIPKFKFDTKFKLVDILGSLGLESLFSEPGFTEMVEAPEGRELFVSSILHAASISVDEEGTEAAAVTVCELMGCCLEEKKPTLKFVADHPFLFVISESESGCILFMGQVLDPSHI